MCNSVLSMIRNIKTKQQWKYFECRLFCAQDFSFHATFMYIWLILCLCLRCNTLNLILRRVFSMRFVSNSPHLQNMETGNGKTDKNTLSFFVQHNGGLVTLVMRDTMKLDKIYYDVKSFTIFTRVPLHLEFLVAFGSTETKYTCRKFLRVCALCSWIYRIYVFFFFFFFSLLLTR